jgi:poly(A) polymerase
MIRDLSGKDEGTGAPRKRRRSSGSKRKRVAGAPSASGE